MTLYTILVFVHVLGAVGMFAAWSIEAIGLVQLSDVSSTTQLPSWLALRRRASKVGGTSMLTAIITGVAMMVMHGGAPWMIGAVAELALIVAVAVVVGRRVAPELAAAAEPRGQNTDTDIAQIASAMAASLRFRIAAGITIVALMTIKPGLPGTIGLIATGVALGAAVALRVTHPNAPAATA